MQKEIVMDEYESKLPSALRSAGYTIQQYFKSKGYGFPDFRWIQTSLIRPSFQHLCFGFKNQVYSVLIALMQPDKQLLISSQDVENQIRECRSNNIIASIIVLNSNSFRPVLSPGGFPLMSTYALEKKNVDIDPFNMNLTEKIEMSPWEIHSIGVQIVREDIENDGGKICSYTDVLGIYPNIWFEKDHIQSPVFVSVSGYGRKDETKPLTLDLRMRTRLSAHKCFKAEVSVENVDDPSKPLYRGDPVSVDYDGIEPFDLEKDSIDGEVFLIK